jgi:enterochelin esterase-like enzyme
MDDSGRLWQGCAMKARRTASHASALPIVRALFCSIFLGTACSSSGDAGTANGSSGGGGGTSNQGPFDAASGNGGASGGTSTAGADGSSNVPTDAALGSRDATSDGDAGTSNDPGTEGDGDYVIGPDYPVAPEMTANPAVPKGNVINFTLSSADSKFFTGINGAFMRTVAVYVPRQYVAGTAAPFIVAQDGATWTPRLTVALDNLIGARRLPPMIAVMVDNGGGDGRGSERGLEYDTVSGKYAEFVEAEVLPRAESEAKVRLTKDPDGRAALGGSSAGSASFGMAWFHPELYHRVLSYSGSFVNLQSPVDPALPHGAWEYHEHLIPESDPKPLRVWLEVGENDLGVGTPASEMRNWVLANQNMAKVLAAKRYHYRFERAKAIAHVNKTVVFNTMPEALIWLWRGYVPP